MRAKSRIKFNEPNKKSRYNNNSTEAQKQEEGDRKNALALNFLQLLTRR